ncbi:galectin-9-like [Salminus brasiliensis]|uniref:galectin-9-like n=1 Tax=Salminus brasiliensis TaxID=930266 RepID=UPI003B82DE04
MMAYQQPFLNPRLPFTGCIQGGLFEGKVTTLTGRVLPGAERFHVNFQCGTTGSADIALHFNPRYSRNSGFVVCNTLQNSSWGSEERSHSMPLPRGSDFNLTFLVNRDSYSVIVNGAHFMEYLHRLSVSRVNAISVEGGVEIHSIAFQNPATPCVPQPVFLQPNSCGMQLGGQVQWTTGQSRGHSRKSRNPQKQHHAGLYQAPPPYSPPQVYNMPYKTIIQGGLYPGKTIIIQGFVNHDANRFCFNLRFNSGIAFHFNPRLNDNHVVRNSLLQDKWGPEERAGGMPFYRGQPFTVTIICDTQCYRIMVNGTQMFTYNHRHFLLQQIDILEVEGNVSLSSVTV